MITSHPLAVLRKGLLGFGLALVVAAMVAPIWELAFLNGHGPRVAESGLTLIAGHPYSSPYEDLRLKGK